jgi:hypothetical protein
MACLVEMARKDETDRAGLWANKDHLVMQDYRDSQDRSVLLDHKDHKEHQD